MLSYCLYKQVLKSKSNLKVASLTNLTIFFVTLSNFIGDVSISNHHT
jgi:hypothetical protein